MGILEYSVKFTLHNKWSFSIKDLFCKFDQIHRKLRIWSRSLKKSLTESFIFRAVLLKMVTHFVPMFLFIYSLCKIYCRILMIIDNKIYNTSRLPAEIITHFSQCFISIPLKMLENFGFLTFLRGVNIVNWTKMYEWSWYGSYRD